LKETKAIPRAVLYARRAERTFIQQILLKAWHNSICISANVKETGLMDSFDKYDEIDYTGKSNPNIWEIHLEFFFSKMAALSRYATIKRLHREAAKKTAVRPFFRPNDEIAVHRDMIKDFTPDAANQTAGVWQFEYWLPSSEQQASDFESKMSKEDPEGRTPRPGEAESQKHPVACAIKYFSLSRSQVGLPFSFLYELF
jgi:hypothetical protein